jgi:hypothetical protein
MRLTLTWLDMVTVFFGSFAGAALGTWATWHWL